MIQLTDVFCVLLRYNGTSNILLQYVADSIIRDPIKRRALYYKEFHGFGQAKFSYDGLICGLSQFAQLPQLPLKMTLNVKVLKID